MGIGMVAGNRRDEGGFTIIEVLIMMLIMGILSVIMVSTMSSYISKSNTQNFMMALPTLGEKLETWAVAHPTAASMDVKNVQLPESLKNKALLIVGNPNDYCIVGTTSTQARDKVQAGDFSYKTSDTKQYFIYTPNNFTVTQKQELNGPSCLATGSVSLLNSGE